MKKIKLTQGQYALVDDEDFEWLNSFNWCYYKARNNGGYAARKVGGRSDPKNVMMHRLVNNTPEGFDTDHHDGNKLNNQKYNLRTATSLQNRYNRNSYKGSTSKYKGVGWFKRDSKWRAYIVKDRKNYHLGLYENEQQAALAYNKKALEFHGKFARLNEVDI